MSNDFLTAGTEISQIPVRISYRIIQLFSDGLYASPNKAIEELVSNAFDAGAKAVHVLLSPDRTADDAVIVVVDDGEGMDEDGLRQHWHIGVSYKRDPKQTPKGRKQIGKFGIGKLATFVLANNLTHICKRDNKYYAVTMDYAVVPEGKDGGIELNGENEGVALPLRELTEEQAKDCMPNLLFGNKSGHKAIELFGPSAPPSWTVAVMSNLKEMAREIQKGRLSWVLRTAMPLRPDFKVFLDGDWLRPTKLDTAPLKKWILGKDILYLDKPASKELEATEAPDGPPEERWGLTHPQLGRITGFAEVYEQRLTEGFERNNGFFVYVLGRLINIDDPHFGVPANALRHGTFARFRMVVRIDKLDDELRSSREAVRDATLTTIAKNILHAVFNIARNWLQEYDAQQLPGFRAANRIRQSPGSLTRRPILGLLKSAVAGKTSPRFINYPRNLSEEAAEGFLQDVETKSSSDMGLLQKIEHVNLSPDDGIAVLDLTTGSLKINLLHPFVSVFEEEFERGDTLSLLCMAEVLTEAYLYNLGLDDDFVFEVMARRNELLRQFARSQKRTANLIAQDLEDAVTDEHKLEIQLVAAFDSLGFDARLISGKEEPDGVAIAHLGASDGKIQRYSVCLEAKSKEVTGKRVPAKDVDISRIAAHRDDPRYLCEHAIVVGPDFSTTRGEHSAVIKDARTNKELTGRTITLMRAHNLARLVRLRALKHIGLNKIRELFLTCVSPEDSHMWVEQLAQQRESPPPYRAILETIWEIQQEVAHEAVDFGSVATALRLKRDIRLDKSALINLCKSMSQLAPEVVTLDVTVELTQRPDIILTGALRTLHQFPEDEQRLASLDLKD